MSFVYVDTSTLLSIAFDEEAAKAFAERQSDEMELFASNLLEAEFRSALRREGLDPDGTPHLSWFRWVYPDRPLSREMNEVLAISSLMGPDLWHVACAMYLQEALGEVIFLSDNPRQAEVARQIGLATG